jgi:UDP-N-acetylmuramate: L-alanyl-gamma-D-glutamyl-meso-diaminopimelate ligase
MVFTGCERVLIMPPPTHGSAGHEQITQDQIVSRVCAAGVNAIGVADGADVLAGLPGSLSGDEVVLLLSSGPLDGLATSLPSLFEAQFGRQR